MATHVPTLETHEDSVKDRTREMDGLITACRAGNPEQLENILKKHKGDSDQFLNLKYQDETTPLHVACCHGNVDCIKLLLENGADGNVYDARGFMSIHCAAANDHVAAIDTLLNFQPHESDFTPLCKVDHGSEYGETPLHVACLMGNHNVVKYLLGKGAELECNDKESNNFLHCVSASDSGPLWGWSIDTINNDSKLAHLVDKQNTYGQTPAHRAASLGCVMSISALYRLKANFELKDCQGRSAKEILHQHGNAQCYSIATGQLPAKQIPSSPMPNRAGLLPPQRTLSSGSSTSPKLVRRSSMTGRKRPAIMAVSLPPTSSMAVARRNSLRSLGSGPMHSRSSSEDGFLNLNVSKENINKLSRLNSATGSEETIQMVIDNSVYEPPLDLNVVKPVYLESITPTKSTIYCKEHGIKFTTNYFKSKSNNKRPKSSSKATTNPPPAQETDIPVCIAAAMHLHISFPSDYTIISPVCFVSCRCEHTCHATLELPHAASVSAGKRDTKEKSLFSVLSFVTFDLKRSLQIEPISPVGERRLEPVTFESLKIENNLVRFKTKFENPCLYAVGIRSSLGPVPRPLAPLRCALFCLYKKFDEQPTIAIIPIRMYVGLNLRTVTVIIKNEAQGTGCEIHDFLFLLSGAGVQLQASLDNNVAEWRLDTGLSQKLKYSQIALTEEIITGNVSYSHSLSYPPHRLVRVLPGRLTLATPVILNLSVLDSESVIIERTSFVPFAPP